MTRGDDERASKARLTVVFGCGADGFKYPPLLIFKVKPDGNLAKAYKKDLAGFPPGVVVYFQTNAWMDAHGMQVLAEQILLPYCNAQGRSSPQQQFTLARSHDSQIEPGRKRQRGRPRLADRPVYISPVHSLSIGNSISTSSHPATGSTIGPSVSNYVIPEPAGSSLPASFAGSSSRATSSSFRVSDILGFEPAFNRVLIMDNFAAHADANFLRILHAAFIKEIFLPPGTTGALQPLDLTLNKAIKDRIRKIYLLWQHNQVNDGTLIFLNNFI